MPNPNTPNSIVGTSGDDELDYRLSTADLMIDGRAGNDTIYGGTGHDSLYGGRGNDLIYASVEDTLIDGGAGVDTVSFIYSGTGVRVFLSDGALGLSPDDPSNPTLRPNVIAKIENVIGSNYDDFLVGNRSVNEIEGRGGNDTLQAWGSGDFLTGGTGADTFYPLTGQTNGRDVTTTITDFHYNEGDRVQMDGSPLFTWIDGFAPDADGTIQQAWIGTCTLQSGGTLQLIVLGADTTPSGDWLI